MLKTFVEITIEVLRVCDHIIISCRYLNSVKCTEKLFKKC